jgi:flagellar basal-body rod protein FlgB
MPFDLDAYLGVHPAALALEARRTEVLANNLANADTPNFKARDVDFRSALANAVGSSGASSLSTAPSAVGSTTGASTSASGDAALKYRVPLAPSLDGNTVDPQLEQAAFAENSVRYQATLTFLNTQLRMLMTAITGS